MSRLAPYRPEWIEELRVVTDNDPQNPDVAFNNGHLLFQSTFFIGPVNFYYSDPDGTKHCAEMNTGDSNWIASFAPHSFTKRNYGDALERYEKDHPAIIIACTYGGQIITSLQALGGLQRGAAAGSKAMDEFSGDRRDPPSVFMALLRRYAALDNMYSMEEL